MPLTLTRAIRSQRAGEPLPKVFSHLDHAGIRPRRGQVTLFFGLPGACKTFIALLWATKMGVPSLYFSLDTDSGTMATRTVAIFTGRTQDDIEASSENFLPILAQSLITYCFTPDMTDDELALELDAYVEINGAYPDIIVIDNLMNLSSAGENEWQGMRQLMKGFHSLARVTGSAVWVLHHGSEGDYNPYVPLPRKAIQGKVAQLPELILSLCAAGDKIGIACVKNRHGPADPTGKNVIWYGVDLSRMKLFENSFEEFAARKRGEWA